MAAVRINWPQFGVAWMIVGPMLGLALGIVIGSTGTPSPTASPVSYEARQVAPLQRERVYTPTETVDVYQRSLDQREQRARIESLRRGDASVTVQSGRE